jgi:hypothetical protein
MAIKYKPLTDEQIEQGIEERLNAALQALNELSDTYIPQQLFEALEGVVEDYDWEGQVVADDYALYEDYVDDHRMDWEEW